jgi:hypothetical protein
LLEWPKFQKAIQSYDPLIILIENSYLEKNHLLDFRKITFFGSENWKNRFQKYNIIY